MQLSGRLSPAAPQLVALAVVIIWGVNFVLLKLALGQFRLLTFTCLRFAGMVALAWLVVALRGERVAIAASDRGRVAAAGLLGYTAYVVLSLVGLNFTTAFSNSLLIAAAPIFSALLLWAWRLEAIGVWRAAGLGVSLAGVVIFMLDKLVTGLGAAGLGDAISLLAAAFFASYTVTLKQLLDRYSAPLLTAWTLTAGAAPVLVLAAPDLLHQDWQRVDGWGWAVLAWSVVVPVYLAWTLWSWASRRGGVAATNTFLYLVPVVSGAASMLLLGERFGLAKLGGALLVLGGVALVASRRSRRTTRPQASDADPPSQTGGLGSHPSGVDSLLEDPVRRGSSSPGRARPSQG